MSNVKPIPDGYNTVTPHLVVKGTAKAVEFYQAAFGAEILGLHKMPGSDAVMHAEIKIGNSIIMLNDEFPDYGALSPLSVGNTSTTLHIYSEDVDALFDRAVKAGATVKMPVADQFWGDRYGMLADPFGHQWSIATHKKDVTEADMHEAMKSMSADCGGQGK